jgi:hypothetical protein
VRSPPFGRGFEVGSPRLARLDKRHVSALEVYAIHSIMSRVTG